MSAQDITNVRFSEATKAPSFLSGALIDITYLGVLFRGQDIVEMRGWAIATRGCVLGVESPKVSPISKSLGFYPTSGIHG